MVRLPIHITTEGDSRCETDSLDLETSSIKDKNDDEEVTLKVVEMEKIKEEKTEEKGDTAEPEDNIKDKCDDSQEVIKIAEQVEAEYEETSGGTDDSQEELIKKPEQLEAEYEKTSGGMKTMQKREKVDNIYNKKGNSKMATKEE